METTQASWNQEFSSEDLKSRIAARLAKPALVAIELDV